jgi:hypothetical protein
MSAEFTVKCPHCGTNLSVHGVSFNKDMNTEEYKMKVEDFFTPDVRVEVDDASRITSILGLTDSGKLFILEHKTIGKFYDIVLQESSGTGVCFEVVDENI